MLETESTYRKAQERWLATQKRAADAEDQLRIEVVSVLGRRLRKLRIDRLTNNSSTSAVG